MATAFLPALEVPDGFQMVRDVAHQLRPELDEWFGYFSNQWITNPHFPVTFWNVHNREDRTNNIAESYHLALKSKFRAAHPAFYEFVQKLRTNEDVYRKDRAKIEAGIIVRRKVMKYVRSNAWIQNLIQQYRGRQGIQRVQYRPEFLRGVSHHLSEMEGVELEDEIGNCDTVFSFII